MRFPAFWASSTLARAASAWRNRQSWERRIRYGLCFAATASWRDRGPRTWRRFRAYRSCGSGPGSRCRPPGQHSRCRRDNSGTWRPGSRSAGRRRWARRRRIHPGRHNRGLAGRIQLATSARRIHARYDMVHDRAITGMKIDRANPAVLGKVRLEHEDAEVVAAGGGERVRLGHRQDQVGLAERPVRGERPGRGPVLGIAFRAPTLDPRPQGGDLVVGQHLGASRNGPPNLEEAGHGGIIRSPVTCARSDPRLRACSYVSKENGAT